MRKLFFFEKKTEFADAAGRLLSRLTEAGIRAVSARVLRCVILNDIGEQGQTLDLETLSLLWDRQTEVPIRESALRAQATRGDCMELCVMPLFQRPAERQTEQALRYLVGSDSFSVRQADLFVVYGEKTPEAQERLRSLLINPVSAAEMRLWEDGMLPPVPAYREYSAAVVRGFRTGSDEGLAALSQGAGFRMSQDDLRFVQSYYTVDEKRDPNLFELRFIDTYWSDHCRHITFLTALEDLKIEDRAVGASFETYLHVRESLYGTRPKNITLMDIATVAARYFRREGRLPQVVETGENNACTLCCGVSVLREEDETPVEEPWLLHFKNETHNDPTGKEPFLGAENSFGATMCDALSARGTVFAAMRLSGSGEPLHPGDRGNGYGGQPLGAFSSAAADGFSAFGAQCGVPVGYVREWMVPGYSVKHMELCMTASAVPAAKWQSKKPIPGDVILLLGAKTGREGLGGALNASAGPENRRTQELYTAQAGDPAEARALMRFLQRQDAAALIKRANDIGSGGLGVAAAELADGVRIDLDKVPTVGMEDAGGKSDPYVIAVSETQERILIVAPAIHSYALQRMAEEENLHLSLIGIVTAEPRFRLLWHDAVILNLSRDFLDSTGAEKRISAEIPQMHTERLSAPPPGVSAANGEDTAELFCRTLSSPEVCAQKPLSAHYDAAAGGRTAVLPFSGKRQSSPLDYMAVRFPVEAGERTRTCAVFTHGFSPSAAEESPYYGAYLSVLEAICRMAASGADTERAVLSLQEVFPAVGGDPVRYGVPLAAMLGAFQAQMDYRTAAPGGKDSMSGTTPDGDVLPTLIAFAAASCEQDALITPDFKKAGSRVYLLEPERREDSLPDPEDERGLLRYLRHLASEGKLRACMALGAGGVAAGIARMCFGNDIGFNFEAMPGMEAGKSGMALFEARWGAFLVETDASLRGTLVGYTKDAPNILVDGRSLPLSMLSEAWQKPQKQLYSGLRGNEDKNIVAGFPYREQSIFMPKVLISKPTVLIPVFPGTCGEDVLAYRFEEAGIQPRRFVFRTRRREDIGESIRAFSAALRETQIIAFPGGGSPGYGSCCASIPDPAACFVRTVFSDPLAEEALYAFRTRSKGLALGLGGGFRLLLAAGFFGEYAGNGTKQASAAPFSLTENRTGRLHSAMVRVKVMSEHSPWMRFCSVGEIYTLPAASSAGRCIIPGEAVLELAEKGQVASQYVDADGNPTMDPACNPFCSDFAVEGVFSEDGRVFGRMADDSLADDTLCVNVPGSREQRIFRAAADYYAIK